MAILSKYLVASSVFSIAALAAPLVQRDLVTETDIVTETVWTTLGFTTTIYDNAGTAAPEVPATSAPAMTITTSAMQMTTVPTSTTAPATTLVPVTTSAAAAPVSSVSAPVAQFFTTSATSAAGGLAEADTTTSSTTTPAPAPTTPATSAAPVASSSPAAAAAGGAAAGSVAAGSTSGTCEGSGAPCVGDVTHWDGGLGACGTVVDSNADLAIALPFEFMGTLSNSNPYCGRSVTLYNPTSGTTVQAVVKDKCMGCVGRAIDCTNTLFSQITDNQGNGRESGIEWWLN